MTLHAIVVVVIYGQLWSVIGKSCLRGFYFEAAVDDCEPCVNICNPRRRTQSLCLLHADQCRATEPQNIFLTSTDSLTAEETKKENRKMVTGTQTWSTNRPERILFDDGLVIGLFLCSFCLLGFVVITVIVTHRSNARSDCVGIFRRSKSKTVHAVHPVEEGNVQIHPSSQTPPRMLFALTSSSSCYSSSSSFLHSSAAVRLLSAFKEAGKPQEDTKDSVIISVNLGHE